VFDPQLLSELP